MAFVPARANRVGDVQASPLILPYSLSLVDRLPWQTFPSLSDGMMGRFGSLGIDVNTNKVSFSSTLARTERFRAGLKLALHLGFGFAFVFSIGSFDSQ